MPKKFPEELGIVIMIMQRRKTRQIKVGGVRIGGGAAVSIQSMVKAETADVKSVVSQIKELEAAGCDIVRVAVKTFDDADAIRLIKRRVKLPLVADIHFDHRLALRSISSGADKVRLNPGNIRSRDEIAQVIRAAKAARIPIRVGVNSGSVLACHTNRLTTDRRPKTKDQGASMTRYLVDAALGYVKLFEELEFRDIIISLKGSDVLSTIEAYRNIAGECDYPLHLGVTASGPSDIGIIKSSIGIGALLLDGIGDTIRVSLTAPPVEEVVAARTILTTLGLRRSGPEIISCPTCGRCQVDMTGIVNDLESELKAQRETFSFQLSAKKPITIALMGCEVNGPGEASMADIGIAFGKGAGMLFKKGKVIKKVRAKDAVKELLKNLWRG